MKESIKKRYKNYLNRFFDPNVSFRQKWAAFWRYSGMAAGLLIEKARGVDYALIYHEDNANPFFGHYTMSPKKVLKRIFDDTENIPDKSFIDVGCGKGYAVKEAAKKGFKTSGGIEYNEHLYEICLSNLKKEKVSTEYVYLGMAQDFEHYDLFDVIYFNNPFRVEILSPVLKKIAESHSGKPCRCYYLNTSPDRAEAFSEAGFRLVKTITDPSEPYFTMNVYEY